MIRSARLFTVLSALSLAAVPAFAEQWEVDPAHTAVMFKVTHMGVSNQYGRFNDVTGSLTTGDAAAAFNFTALAESVDTNSAKRDDHLRSPDFFNAKQFPTITFAGSSITPNDQGMELAGELSLHGVTQPLTVQLTKIGEAEDRGGGTRIGLETTFTINRSDFGMDQMVGPVGDEVTLTISFEATSK